MKINISIDLSDTLKKSVTEWDNDDEDTIDKAQSKLPIKKGMIILDKDETQIKPPGTKPVVHKVKKGETLKKICEKYSVSYGELTNYMMAKNGSTMIAPGMEIEIPRHFIDLSQA